MWTQRPGHDPFKFKGLALYSVTVKALGRQHTEHVTAGHNEDAVVTAVARHGGWEKASVLSVERGRWERC